MKINLTKEIIARINKADNTGHLRSMTVEELEVAIRRGLDLFHANGGAWDNLDPTGKADCLALGALTLYNLVSDEKNYK
ncbi:hypothetical protein [Niabella drilacis]|uniref:Uncharacterized protein n=1 Tax=Niabella drilacis (strain DSM 25811 / CCM 8410 / CCUG 62505 / LMG 26954 / E90) TaxID=1285928 RepID=A0A1G6XGD7_NIADE|nr:hypothetical protein [Niabella drilacis]SDD77121.1 hypothetical protein SAMN04487894_11364 [Niabella drilacis]